MTVNIVDCLANTDFAERILVSTGIWVLDEVSLEKALHDIRPDIIAITTNSTRFLIEIANTHFIDDAKQTKLEKYGLPVVEIDVSQIKVITFEALSQVLFESSEKSKWIYHPESESIRKQLLASLKPQLDAALLQRTYLAKRNAEHLENKKRRQEIEVEKEANKLAIKAAKAASYKSLSVRDK